MIRLDYPPNFGQILEKFPRSSRHGVLFAYGEDIYNPSNVAIPRWLAVHEYRHCARQWQNAEAWWAKYLTDDQFRYDEELLAHVDEYKEQAKNAQRNFRRILLVSTAKRLASSLYEYGVGVERAAQDIKQLVTGRTRCFT